MSETLGADLLLVAVNPRTGRIWTIERIGFALRAVELIELTLAGRVALAGERITVRDPEPLGEPRLDEALETARMWVSGPTVDEWLRERSAESGPGIVRRYLDSLVDEGAVRVESKGEGVALRTRIGVLDEERRAAVVARIDAVAQEAAYSAATADASDVAPRDRALAGVVHACGLGQHLFRGLRGRAVRRGLDRLADHSVVTAGTRAVVEAADAEFTEAITRALSSGIAKLGREVSKDMYRHQQAQSHHHHGDGGSGAGGHHGHHGHHGGHDGGGGHGGGHHA